MKAQAERHAGGRRVQMWARIAGATAVAVLVGAVTRGCGGNEASPTPDGATSFAAGGTGGDANPSSAGGAA